MAIRSITMDYAGQEGIFPRRGTMVTTDSLATITTAGYLNNNKNTNGINFLANDFLFVNYDAPSTGEVGGDTGVFDLTISNGIITMVAITPTIVRDITLGVTSASHVVTLDSDSEVDGVAWTDYTAAASGSATFNSTAINNVVTLSTTPASGSCAAQFKFVNSAGTTLSSVLPIQCYVSSSAGAVSTAVTSVAVLTNGALATVVTGRVALASCSASGLLGVTLTASAGTYYLTFMLPNGKIAISSALVVNA